MGILQCRVNVSISVLESERDCFADLTRFGSPGACITCQQKSLRPAETSACIIPSPTAGIWAPVLSLKWVEGAILIVVEDRSVWVWSFMLHFRGESYRIREKACERGPFYIWEGFRLTDANRNISIASPGVEYVPARSDEIRCLLQGNFAPRGCRLACPDTYPVLFLPDGVKIRRITSGSELSAPHPYNTMRRNLPNTVIFEIMRGAPHHW